MSSEVEISGFGLSPKGVDYWDKALTDGAIVGYWVWSPENEKIHYSRNGSSYQYNQVKVILAAEPLLEMLSGLDYKNQVGRKHRVEQLHRKGYGISLPPWLCIKQEGKKEDEPSYQKGLQKSMAATAEVIKGMAQKELDLQKNHAMQKRDIRTPTVKEATWYRKDQAAKVLAYREKMEQARKKNAPKPNPFLAFKSPDLI